MSLLRQDLYIVIQIKSYAVYLLIEMEILFPETAAPQHATRLSPPVGIIENELCGTAGAGIDFPMLKKASMQDSR